MGLGGRPRKFLRPRRTAVKATVTRHGPAFDRHRNPWSPVWRASTAAHGWGAASGTRAGGRTHAPLVFWRPDGWPAWHSSMVDWRQTSVAVSMLWTLEIELFFIRADIGVFTKVDDIDNLLSVFWRRENLKMLFIPSGTSKAQLTSRASDSQRFGALIDLL